MTAFCFRYTCSLALLLLTCLAKGQLLRLPKDSLSKYSYTIFGMISKSKELEAGTCSFYEKNGELFLITAKHLLYDCDPFTKRQTPKFEIAYIHLSANIGTLHFKVPDTWDSCEGNYKDTDLFVYKADTEWRSKVNTIEQFVIPPGKKSGKFTFYGQGIKTDSRYITLDKQHNVQLRRKSFKIFRSTPVPDSSYVDTIHHFVQTRIITSGKRLKGYSGSPTFLRDSKSGEWRYCGVLVQALIGISNSANSGLILVSPDFVFRSIEEMREGERRYSGHRD